MFSLEVALGVVLDGIPVLVAEEEVVLPVITGSDEAPTAGVVDEILELATSSSVLLVELIPDPGVSSTELKVDGLMRDGELVDVTEAPVGSPEPVESNVIVVLDKPSVLGVSVPPSAVN